MAILGNEKPMDQHTLDLLTKVTQQINIQNQKLVSHQLTNTQPINGTYTGYATTTSSYTAVIPSLIQPEDIEPSPNINMESDIYKNEFEEFKSVEIGCDEYQSLPGVGQIPACAAIGLIDSISEDENDLYAKFPNGEIVPFKGHSEKFEIEIFTWNDLHRSDLIGSEVKKAATCHILVNDRLARIIEGTDVQDLLMKADRAIDELKAMPFSICRDGLKLIGREIYYDNQPAIINNVDELNNLINIVPDTNYLTNFNPPAYALEDDESDEWITNFGQGMMIRDYDEKIWWWRNNKGESVDPSTDPFYEQFPQPSPQPPLTAPNYPHPINPNVFPGTSVSPGASPYTTAPYIITTPFGLTTTPFGTGSDVTWTIAQNNIDNIISTYSNGPLSSSSVVTWDSGLTDTGTTTPVNDKDIAKEYTKAITIHETYNAKDKDPDQKSYFNKRYGKLSKFDKTQKVLKKLSGEPQFPDKEYDAEFAEDKIQ